LPRTDGCASPRRSTPLRRDGGDGKAAGRQAPPRRFRLACAVSRDPPENEPILYPLLSLRINRVDRSGFSCPLLPPPNRLPKLRAVLECSHVRHDSRRFWAAGARNANRAAIELVPRSGGSECQTSESSTAGS